MLHVIQTHSHIFGLETLLFLKDGLRLLLQCVEIDSLGIPFAFPDDEDVVNFIYGNEVDFIQIVFLPIVGDNIIEPRFAVFLSEVTFKDFPGEGFIVGQHLSCTYSRLPISMALRYL